MLGDGIAKDLFEENDPVGKKIKIKDQNFTVIGVFKKKKLGWIWSSQSG